MTLFSPRSHARLSILLIFVFPPAAIAQAPPKLPTSMRRVEDFLHSRGYSADPGEIPAFFRTIGSRAPSDVPGLGSNGTRMYFGIQRKCPDSLQTTIRDCIRYDAIEAYAGPGDGPAGVIPLTLVGPRAAYLTEYPASKDAEGDAALAARAAHITVFHPTPLIVQRPPEDSAH